MGSFVPYDAIASKSALRMLIFCRFSPINTHRMLILELANRFLSVAVEALFVRIKSLCSVITLLLSACGDGGIGDESPIAAAVNVMPTLKVGH